MISRRCLIDECPHNKIPKLSSRQDFFHHVMKTSTEHIIEVLKRYDLVIHPELLCRFTLLNIFTDFCYEPFANTIINGDDR